MIGKATFAFRTKTTLSETSSIAKRNGGTPILLYHGLWTDTAELAGRSATELYYWLHADEFAAQVNRLAARGYSTALLAAFLPDSSGAESYNLNLSQQRADAVRDFLVANGIDPERIKVQGYGEAKPVASNTNEAGRRENRRVEVIMVREGERVANRGR